MKHIDHVVLILDDLLLSLGFIVDFVVLPNLLLSLLEPRLELLPLLLLRKYCRLQVVFDFLDLVELGLLYVKCLLQSVLIFNSTFFLYRHIVLLIR